jgi:hypothetical protein
LELRTAGVLPNSYPAMNGHTNGFRPTERTPSTESSSKRDLSSGGSESATVKRRRLEGPLDTAEQPANAALREVIEISDGSDGGSASPPAVRRPAKAPLKNEARDSIGLAQRSSPSKEPTLVLTSPRLRGPDSHQPAARMVASNVRPRSPTSFPSPYEDPVEADLPPEDGLVFIPVDSRMRWPKVGCLRVDGAAPAQSATQGHSIMATQMEALLQAFDQISAPSSTLTNGVIADRQLEDVEDDSDIEILSSRPPPIQMPIPARQPPIIERSLSSDDVTSASELNEAVIPAPAGDIDTNGPEGNLQPVQDGDLRGRSTSEELQAALVQVPGVDMAQEETVASVQQPAPDATLQHGPPKPCTIVQDLQEVPMEVDPVDSHDSMFLTEPRSEAPADDAMDIDEPIQQPSAPPTPPTPRFSARLPFLARSLAPSGRVWRGEKLEVHAALRNNGISSVLDQPNPSAQLPDAAVELVTWTFQRCAHHSKRRRIVFADLRCCWCSDTSFSSLGALLGHLHASHDQFTFGYIRQVC